MKARKLPMTCLDGSGTQGMMSRQWQGATMAGTLTRRCGHQQGECGGLACAPTCRGGMLTPALTSSFSFTSSMMHLVWNTWKGTTRCGFEWFGVATSSSSSRWVCSNGRQPPQQPPLEQATAGCADNVPTRWGLAETHCWTSSIRRRTSKCMPRQIGQQPAQQFPGRRQQGGSAPCQTRSRWRPAAAPPGPAAALWRPVGRAAA